jgi:hypothetical protein
MTHTRRCLTGEKSNPGRWGVALAALVALSICTAAMAGVADAAGLTITPVSVAANYTGTIALDITGLATGQTVLVETFLDINGNGTIDTGDLLVQSFQVTDGQALTIGGVRNTNVPGDEDGLADGKIHTLLNFARSGNGFDAVTTSVAKFIYQVSPATSGFTPVPAPFTITQPAYAQKVAGTVTSGGAGGAAVPYAFTFLIDPAFNGAPIIMALADANGNFTLSAAPGSYAVFALDAGFVADSSAAPVVTVNTGATVPQNLSLTAANRSISGSLTDLDSGAGIPGVLISVKSSSGLLAVGFSDASGNFAIPVSSASTQWKLDPDEQSLALSGYLALNGKYKVDISGGSVSGVSIQLPKATALIYGTLKDDQGNPLAGVDIYADTDQYEGYGLTDSTGNYVVGVTAGTWSVGPDSDELTALGYLETGASVNVTDSHSLEQDFIAQHVTAYLMGQLVDTMDNGVGNIGVYACPQGSGNCSNSTTNSDGTFSIGVFGGTWNLSFSSDDLANQNLIGPQLPFTVTDGVNQTGIVAVALAVTSSITGTVQDSNGNPIPNLGVYAFANISGTQYNAGSQTNDNGNYAFGVANGTWQVGLNCQGDNSLNSLGLPCVNNQSVTVPSQNQTVNFTVPVPCVGDCNSNGRVTIDDILTMVNIALGNVDVSACLAGDANDDGQITVDEILTAVNNALNGCTIAEEQGCVASGGTVTTAMCCATAPDFPDTCAIGACGCSPQSSHDVGFCDCGAGACFDRTKLACTSS